MFNWLLSNFISHKQFLIASVVDAHMFTDIETDTCMHAHTHIHTHARTHTHAHTHTQTEFVDKNNFRHTLAPKTLKYINLYKNYPQNLLAQYYS